MTGTRIMAFTAVIAATAGAPAVARAHLYLSLEAGRFRGDDAVMEVNADAHPYTSSRLEPAPLMGARLGYAFVNGMGHGVSIDLGAHRFRARLRGDGQDLGTVQLAPITAVISYVYLPPSGRGVGAHVGMGFGPVRPTFSGGTLPSSGGGANAFEFPFGAEFHFSRWVSVGAEIRLLLTTWDASFPGRPSTQFQAVERELLATLRLWVPGT